MQEIIREYAVWCGPFNRSIGIVGLTQTTDNPDLLWQEVRQVMCDTCDKIGEDMNAYDQTLKVKVLEEWMRLLRSILVPKLL